MNDLLEFEKKTKILIDELKSVCANAGLGNDGNEYRVITQIFLYKFLNDRFLYEIKKIDRFKNVKKIEKELLTIKEKDYEIILLQLDEQVARFYPNQLINSIFEKQNEKNFSKIFDDNLIEISKNNNDIFSINTAGGQKIRIFDNVSQYVQDNRDNFCVALINKLVLFSFENIFNKGFDFFATIFEYLIKDYNSNSGGKYAEYFTPHVVSKIMSKCLVNEKVKNVSCYDPSAGSGTLLMNLANVIGEDKCTIFSQDISQKSSQLLRLNLILNNLTHSLPNIIQGNTMLSPYHKDKNNNLKKFDYIVSNPPFKTDFSDYRNDIDNKKNKDRFYAGIPKIPLKQKDKMTIYLIFIQHIIYSLSENGSAAIVVPTGFITAQTGIEFKIRQSLVERKLISGLISMPGNIFAATPTSVSILFLKKDTKNKSVFLIDASKLGTSIKEGKVKKIILSNDEEKKIIETFNEKKQIKKFSIKVPYEKIKENDFSFSAAQYFDIEIKFDRLPPEKFNQELKDFIRRIKLHEEETKKINKNIIESLKIFKDE